ncbi:MAG: imidazolonepropionase [Actinobacteria bacterium]|nr:imidazolonepropionase [Actinomycetota bacterium]
MTALVVDRIGLLVTNDETVGEGRLGIVRDAAVVIEDGSVVAVVPAGAAGDERLDAAGACVIPGFVDSHTHPVFAGDRSAEFAARMAGRPYAAGGIHTTVAATRSASEPELRAGLRRRVAEAHRGGTTHLEAKSGYGLTVEHELRLLRLAGEITDDTTLMAAHVVTAERAGAAEEYVDLVCGAMVEAAAPLARWIDVFCERGAFDGDQTRRVLEAGQAAGLGLRVHAAQLGPGPGVQIAVELGAASADHCTHLTGADVDALGGSTTVATLLPASDFSTRQPYPDGRRLVDAGATVALATNCNPGSSFTTAMALCIALAVRDCGLTVEEALWAATAGGARALRRDDIGRIAPGARADLALLDAPSYLHLAYRPGMDLVLATVARGALVWARPGP